MQLPDGRQYDSLDENDGPTGEILEDEQLIGVDDKCPADSDGATTGGSPTRAATVLTNAKEQSKQLTKKQEAHAADMSKWSPLKTDGTELRRFPRPAFLPFKAGTEPPGFVAGPEHEKGGPRPELRVKLTTLGFLGFFFANVFIIHLTLYGHGRARPKGTADRHATQQRPISTSDATAGRYVPPEGISAPRHAHSMFATSGKP